jgi:tungstate transport system ATP-binding protein
MESLLEVKDLIVKYAENVILDLPELTLFKGEVLILLGPNGAGKSTLLLLAGGLINSTRGSVQFSDHPHLSELEYRRKVSTVFQSPLLLDETVEKNVASGLHFRGLPSTEIHKRTHYWMEQLHISHLAKRQAKILSGGESQRVSLARAFCLETELILMDEPFSALDAPTRQQLLEDLRNILRSTDQTCIFVTHDLEEALAIGDRVAIFFDGKLHQIDEIQSVFMHPATAEVAAYMGTENIIAGTVVNQDHELLQIQAKNAVVEAVANLEIGTQVFICLRPEDVTLFNVAKETEVSSARNHITCHITNIINQGLFVRVQMDAGFPLIALITRSSVAEMNLGVGKQVVAVFKASAIHLIAAGNNKIKN